MKSTVRSFNFVNRNRKPRHTTLVGAFTFHIIDPAICCRTRGETWLVNQSSLDDFFFTFYPNIYKLEVDDAFGKAFGLTMEQFYIEFEKFLEFPANQQMAVLPNP